MGFTLCQTGQNRKQQFALHLSGVNILFFEENVDSHTAKSADGLNALHCVAGKAADGLHNDIIANFPGIVILNLISYIIKLVFSL